MGRESSLEDKLDRYYDDLMGKLLELAEVQTRLIGENKELKKEISHLRETALQVEAGVEVVQRKLTALKVSSGGGSYNGEPMNGDETQPPKGPTSDKPATDAAGSRGAVTPTPPPQAAAPAKTVEPVKKAAAEPDSADKGGGSRSLKDYLAQEISIFDVKVLNAFIRATKEIIKANCRTEPGFLKPRIEKNLILPAVVAGKMFLSRDKAQGSMAIAFERDSIDLVARDVLYMGVDQSPTENDCRDVTSELCNQVCGRSKILLRADGYNFNISLPEVFSGAEPKALSNLIGFPKVALVFTYRQEHFYVLFWG